MSTTKTINESPASRSTVANGASSTYELVFNCLNYSGPDEILPLVKGMTPQTVTVDGYVLGAKRTIDITPMDGTGNYEATVSYKHESKEDEDNEDAEPDDEPGKVQFAFGTASKFINDAIAQEIDYPTGITPYVDIGKKININEKGHTEGLDILGNSVTMTIQKTFSGDVITNAKLKELMGYVTQTNSKKWRSLEIGCVLLKGIDGSQNAEGNWDLTFNFEYKKQDDFVYNYSGPNGSTSLTNTDVPGWDYVWVLKGAKPNHDDADNTKEYPIAVCSAQVYERFDFALLGID